MLKGRVPTLIQRKNAESGRGASQEEGKKRAQSWVEKQKNTGVGNAGESKDRMGTENWPNLGDTG